MGRGGKRDQYGRFAPLSGAVKPPATGERNHKWNGGMYRSYHGYWMYSAGPHRGRLVHRVLMETLAGRKLEPNEDVHHLDFDRLHNCPHNLLLLPRRMHRLMHMNTSTPRDMITKMFAHMGDQSQDELHRDDAPDWVTGGDAGWSESGDDGTTE